MEQINHMKAMVTAVFALVSSALGILFVPVVLVVASNIIDYITGLMASKYRSQDINSYTSIRGIWKKVGMWMLIVVGAIVDALLEYASSMTGITLPFTFLVACIVAVWIVCNELISIVENIKDMGVHIPGFIEPLIRNIKSQIEEIGEEQKDRIEKDEGDV